MFQPVTIDDKFLTDVGLGDLSSEDSQQAIDNIRESLEAKVGIKITQSLNDTQVDDFNNLLSGDDPKSASDWIENNIPNYREIVMKELDSIIEQIKLNNFSFIKRL